MRTTLLIILILLLLSLGGNVLQWRSAERALDDRMADHSRAEKRDLKRLGQLDSANAQIQTLISERDSKYLRDSLKNKSQEMAINALKRRVTGPPVVQDTIIVFQDRLIASMDGQFDTLYMTDNVVFDSLTSINQELKSMVVSGLARQVDLRDRLRQERAKKWSIGIGAGLDYRGKPTVALTMSRQIFRFSLKKR